MTAKIPLQNDEYAIVDKEDYERCMEHIWTASELNTPHTKISRNTVWLSSFVLGSDPEEGEITFKNKNKLDCRKNNLIIVSRLELNRRRRPSINSRSKYKGVDWQKSNKKWRARIQVKGKQIHLGLFDDEDDAAKAYNAAALEHFGEHFHLNKIGEDNRVKKKPLNKNPQIRRVPNKYAGRLRGAYKNHGKFSSMIGFEGKNIYLGNFNTPEQAAKAYDKKAYELYGDKAILNFP